MSLLVSDPESSSSSSSPQPTFMTAKGPSKEPSPKCIPAPPSKEPSSMEPSPMEPSSMEPSSMEPSSQTEGPSESTPYATTQDHYDGDPVDTNAQDEMTEPRPCRNQKVPIRLQAIGSTAAIQPSSFSVAGSQSIASFAKYIMRKLRLKTVHVYVSNSFEPTPEELLGDLYQGFKTNNVLNLSYCESIAFG